MAGMTKWFKPGTWLKLLAVCLVAFLAACGGSGETLTTPPTSPSAEGWSASVLRDRPKVLARSAKLSVDSTAMLLNLPFGRLLVDCRSGGVVSRFEAKRDSVEVVVRSGETVVSGGVNRYHGNKNLGRTFTAPRMSVPDIQNWSFTRFAMAGVTPTTMTVTATRGAPGTIFRCGVSAVATVGPAGGTLTR